MNNYQSAIKRINNAKTENSLQKVESGITRVYNAGFFTENEFMRLDGKILNKKIRGKK